MSIMLIHDEETRRWRHRLAQATTKHEQDPSSIDAEAPLVLMLIKYHIPPRRLTTVPRPMSSVNAHGLESHEFFIRHTTTFFNAQTTLRVTPPTSDVADSLSKERSISKLSPLQR